MRDVLCCAEVGGWAAGRRVATEEEFACLKGAPKEVTAGADATVKPFGVEIRMVSFLGGAESSLG